jgi:hypothetical protein
MQTPLRVPDHQSALAQLTRLHAIERIVPKQTVEEVLQNYHNPQKRVRKLSLTQVVYLLIAMHLFQRERLALVLERIWHTWTWLTDNNPRTPPNDSAIHYRRDQLTVAPLVDLFHRICKPLAQTTTRGAFLQELRLVAFDGKRFNLPDTTELAKVFGKPTTDRGEGAFPQAKLCALCEIGTRAYLDAGIWPAHADEHQALRRLLRSVQAGMLLLADRGLYSADLLQRIRGRGAHALLRLPAGVQPRHERYLPDGSSLVWVAPNPHQRQDDQEILVRMIRYTFVDPNNPGCGHTYRLITTLLDYRRFPASLLAQTYHERWIIERQFAETQEQLLGGKAPLRSQSVCGVLQEIYSLLIAHYVVRALMHEAALAADIDPDTISFKATLVILQECLPDFQRMSAYWHPQLFARLLQEIARHRVQERPPRSYARVVRRKMSNFPLKRAKHRGYRKCLPYKDAIAVI